MGTRQRTKGGTLIPPLIRDLFLNYRKKEGLTHRELAEKLGYILTPNSICEVEKGKWVPSLDKIKTWCLLTHQDYKVYYDSVVYSKLYYNVKKGGR